MAFYKHKIRSSELVYLMKLKQKYDTKDELGDFI